VVNTSVDVAIGLTEKPYASVKVTKNGKPIDAKVSKYATVSVTVSDIDYSAEYEITVSHSVLSPLSKLKREALLKLQKAEGSCTVRGNLDKNIRESLNPEKLRGAILTSDLSVIERVRLSETVIED
jgi:hypothetical protein